MAFFSSLFGSKKNNLDKPFVKDCLSSPDLALRTLTEKFYDGAWSFGKTKSWADDKCNEAANVATLTNYYEVASAFKLPQEKVAELAKWESLPFNKLPHELSKNTLIEYIVWRQQPDKANMRIIIAAMDNLVLHLKQIGADDLLDGLRSDPYFAWLPWRKFIS